MNDAMAESIGKRAVEIFNLKETKSGTFKTGFGDKNLTGLGRVLLTLATEVLESI